MPFWGIILPFSKTQGANRMGNNTKPALAYGKVDNPTRLGELLRNHRRQGALRLQDVSNISMLGMRFISEVERGKETAEIGKIFTLLANLGLVMEIRPRGDR